MKQTSRLLQLRSLNSSSTLKIPTVILFEVIHLVKYLGLLTLKELLDRGDRSMFGKFKHYVVSCFKSEDPSIKNRAL